MQENLSVTLKDKWKWPKLILKILVTATCLWYVAGKIEFQSAGKAIKAANPVYILIAAIAFIISKIISAFRLNIYFRNISIYIAQGPNLRLYWLGMFYNLFLPGSIGGDAYKVIRLTKKYGVPYKKTTAAVLLDRISGLAGLGLIMGFMSVFVFQNPVIPGLIIIGGIFSVGILYLAIRKWFPYFIPGFLPTLLAGIAVQAVQVICVCAIMTALGIPINNIEYLFLFLISSVVSVLPLTVGGLGIREVVFLEGAAYFGLQEEKSILISLLFYLITLITSAFGGLYVFRDPITD